MKTICLFFSLFVIVALSACQSIPTQPAAPLALSGYKWNLVELNGQPVGLVGARETPHLLFLEGEQRLAGSTGCNRIMGRYEVLEDGSLKIGPLVSTRMACPDMATEAAFLKALNNLGSSKQAGNSLLLLDASDKPLARLEAEALPANE